MILTGSVLLVRTADSHYLRDGDIVDKGPYGVMHDVATESPWRFKGADKGITNGVIPNPSTIVAADSDINHSRAVSGKRRSKLSHKIERAPS